MPLRFFSGCLLWLDGEGMVKIFIVLSLSLFLEFQVSICIDSLLLKEAFIYVKGFHIFVSVIEAFGVWIWRQKKFETFNDHSIKNLAESFSICF